jgi:hypothetical protein
MTQLSDTQGRCQSIRANKASSPLNQIQRIQTAIKLKIKNKNNNIPKGLRTLHDMVGQCPNLSSSLLFSLSGILPTMNDSFINSFSGADICYNVYEFSLKTQENK